MELVFPENNKLSVTDQAIKVCYKSICQYDLPTKGKFAKLDVFVKQMLMVNFEDTLFKWYELHLEGRWMRLLKISLHNWSFDSVGGIYLSFSDEQMVGHSTSKPMTDTWMSLLLPVKCNNVITVAFGPWQYFSVCSVICAVNSGKMKQIYKLSLGKKLGYDPWWRLLKHSVKSCYLSGYISEKKIHERNQIL